MPDFAYTFNGMMQQMFTIRLHTVKLNAAKV